MSYAPKNPDPTLRKLHHATKLHKGYGYIVVTQVYDNTDVESVTYECNCSVFHTEAEVQKFIEEIYFIGCP